MSSKGSLLIVALLLAGLAASVRSYVRGWTSLEEPLPASGVISLEGAAEPAAEFAVEHPSCGTETAAETEAPALPAGATPAPPSACAERVPSRPAGSPAPQLDPPAQGARTLRIAPVVAPWLGPSVMVADDPI